MPPKTLEADHELDSDGRSTGHLMSDHDKAVNVSLAGWLDEKVRSYVGKKLKADSRPTHQSQLKMCLDIGSKYPYLSHCLSKKGFMAFGMDGIDSTDDYGKDLGVTMMREDFEAWEPKTESNYHLITMIHCFEHMYEPLSAMKKLRRLVREDGLVFLRLPDNEVSGFERDLTPGHYTIHPFFHSLSSVLEILVRTAPTFEVLETTPMNGAGQRDILLRPIKQRRRVGCGIIAKNEERDLPRCIRTLKDAVDGLVVVDTGSKDRTIEAATEAAAAVGIPLYTETFLEASKLEDGDYKLYDFSKARNYAVKLVEARMGVDWFLWMDSDDQLLTPEVVRRHSYRADAEAFANRIILGKHGDSVHHRLWRARRGIKFEGAIHEYPNHGIVRNADALDLVVEHDATPVEGNEDANARNLRILLHEAENSPSLRTYFYLGNTHRDGGRYEEAIPWYDKRLLTEGYRDEFLFALLYKARCQRQIKQYAGATNTLLRAAAMAPGWAEFWMELAYMHQQDIGNHQAAIGYAMLAHGSSIPPTFLWREPNKYKDQPARVISWSYEHMGNFEDALKWAEIARPLIGEVDEDWEARISRLEEKRVEGIKPIFRQTSLYGKVHNVALIRPGAIGDILMTLNLLPRLRERYESQRLQVWYACHPSLIEPLENVMLSAGVDVVCEEGQLPPNIEHAYRLIGYPLKEGYPEKLMTKHLLEYFAEEAGLTGKLLHKNKLPQLSLPFPDLPSGFELESESYVTLQIKTGWSPYKNWPVERWIEVVERLKDKISFVQIGGEDEERIPGCIYEMGNLDNAIRLVANAKLHVGLDSFANHLTHYLWRDDVGYKQTPGVILFGSTQVSASGYPTNTNISLGLACQPCFREDPKISSQPRGICPNPKGQTYEDPQHACMMGIGVEEVVAAIEGKLKFA